MCMFSTNSFAQERVQPGQGQAKPHQEPSNPEESGETQLTSNGEEDKNKKVAAIRVWNFSGQEERENIGVIAVPLDSSSVTESVTLGRSMKYSRTGNYRLLPEGKYRFHIFSDPSSAFDPEKEIKPEGLSLLSEEKVTVDLKEGEYVTLFLQGKVSDLKPEIIIDSEFDAETYHLRAINLTASDSNSIYIAVNGELKPVFEDMKPQEWMIVQLDPFRFLNFEVRYDDGSGYILKQTVEIDTRGNRSNTLIVSYDRYDRTIIRGYEDAPITIEGQLSE